MCDIKKHYQEYAAAEAALRRFGVSKDMPGFEYLRAGADKIRFQIRTEAYNPGVLGAGSCGDVRNMSRAQFSWHRREPYLRCFFI